MWRRSSFLAAAILALITATGAFAQSSRQGTYIYQDQYRPGYYTPSAPVYYPPYTAPAASVENSRAFYPGAEPDKVLINVTAPADARISFQGQPTTQTGVNRRFVSPPITAGYRYSYIVQATWMENGREISQTRSFAVQPGDIVNIAFTPEGVTVQSK